MQPKANKHSDEAVANLIDSIFLLWLSIVLIIWLWNHSCDYYTVE